MTRYRLDTGALIDALDGTPLHSHASALATAVDAQGHALKHGHLGQWEAALAQLPASTACPWSVVDGAVTIDMTDSAEQAGLYECLQALTPWRKGPFRFGSIHIDTEWRSDWKWNRLAPHISSLERRAVLDVGCGNGYHLWRARQAGAAVVLGIDPSLLYVQQFAAAQHFIQDRHVQLLPLPMEALPDKLQVFDTVFSMGVLYHRRDPHEHLTALRQSLKPGGELVLETLVGPGETNRSQPIDGRDDNMRNAYELPENRGLNERGLHEGF